MKLKSKGKVHPSPPAPERDAPSVLKSLPAAILALAMLLSLEDREVLAYLISRSLNTTTKNKPPKKHPSGARFGCDCFDCYTSYWFRWDSSPSRELINEAVEAFEDHLAAGERPRRRRRDRNGRRVAATSSPAPEVFPEPEIRDTEVESEAIGEPTKLATGVLGSIKSRIWGFWNPNHVQELR